jgi:hypothetical protein
VLVLGQVYDWAVTSWQEDDVIESRIFDAAQGNTVMEFLLS